MAAFVDTGAQVTVISASAAKRAGIYHLMDRRYAGRATGVGHCRVLGRIPARHVHFILGGEEGRGGSCFEDDHDDDDCDNVDEGGNAVQMDGPALTVLEGTVTKGVDVLLGLDVLQDWEAEIRMGPKKSITVKKRRNRSGGNGSPVVIPFVSNAPQTNASRRQQHSRRSMSTSMPLADKPPRSSAARTSSSTASSGHRQQSSSHAPSKSTTHSHHARRKQSTSSYDFDDFLDEDEDDFEDFSPTASDIESDLDLLDGGRNRNSKNVMFMANSSSSGGRKGIHPDPLDDDDVSSVIGTGSDDNLVIGRGNSDDILLDDNEEEDEDDYLQDVDDEASDDEFDMAGL